MVTNNSNNNTTLDIALEELLNNTEFRQQYDTTYIPPTTIEIETTSSSDTIHAHDNVSSTKTTPNLLNIVYLHVNMMFSFFHTNKLILQYKIAKLSHHLR